MTSYRSNHWRAALLATTALAACAGPAMAQTVEPSSVVDEVVVTGIRASLAKSVDIKRTATGVVDSIVAEDIAQFPQSNLAEAVQRVSGVQIRRDYNGAVGNEISIRGLPPEFTQVLINGQSAVTNAESRVFNFNVMPAELFRRVDVFKSVTADLEEGGIAGTVSLETIKPLDFGNRRAVLSLEGVYNEITDTKSPRATAAFGRTWGNKGGVVIGATYSEFSAASQSYDAVRWTRRNFDVNGDRVNDYTNVFLMDLPRYIHEQQDVKRFSVTGTGQYRFNDNVELVVDGLYVKTDQGADRLSPIWSFDTATGLTALSVRDGAVDFADYRDVRYRSENNTEDRSTQMFKVGATLDIDAAGWKLKPFASFTRSSYTLEGYRFFGDRRSQASYDVRQDDDYFVIKVPFDIADATQLTTSEARHNTIDVVDQETALGFDAKRELFQGLEVKVGYKYRARSKERERFSRTLSGLNEPFAPIARVFTGFLDNEDRATGPHSFAVNDFAKSIAAYGSRLDLSASEEINNRYDVNETVNAGYVMGTFDRGPWRVNAGLRLQHTGVNSIGQERIRPAGTLADRTVKTSYTDLLPSVNIRYEVLQNLFIRGAAAKVLTRPNLADLNSYREINEATRTISARNPDLKPTRANQYDLGAEWYFAKGAILSVGYFYKDVKGFIADRSSQTQLNGVAYTLTQPINLNDASIQGVELNYQHQFTFLPAPFNGLGVAANYTYTDTSYTDVLPGGNAVTYGLPNNSKDSYNLVLYYEDSRFSLRGAYNFRGVFLREVPNEQDGLKYRGDYGQADISARYKLNDKISLTLDILNALNAVQEEYVFEDRLTDGTYTTGRTIQFGVRARF